MLALHFTAPSSSLYFPNAQTVQVKSSAALWYCPAAQGTHHAIVLVLLWAALYTVPKEHREHTLSAPRELFALSWNCPGVARQNASHVFPATRTVGTLGKGTVAHARPP